MYNAKEYFQLLPQTLIGCRLDLLLNSHRPHDATLPTLEMSLISSSYALHHMYIAQAIVAQAVI